jgi:Fe-S-cluster containining protein
MRPEIPVSQLEILGIWWYVLEKLDPGMRENLRERLITGSRSIRCPFLVDARCAVYPVRPLACRFLHVFGEPCKPEEIPVQDRPGDVWLPREAVPRALFIMLEYFGFKTAEERLKAMEEGYLATVSSLMSEFPWANLARAKKKE